MFRILIVEDIEDTLHQLETFISEDFSDLQQRTIVEIHTAMSVTQAHDLIERAFAQKWQYDAIILDFNLPDQIGLPARVDESVCSRIRTLMPSTLVAHISAYQDDELVKNHLRKAHQGDSTSASLIFSKVDCEYPIELVKHLKAAFLSQIVEKQMNRLFGDEAKTSLPQRQKGFTESRSLTHELGTLCRDIEANWEDLDEIIRARIETTFKVNETDGRVTVSLKPSLSEISHCKGSPRHGTKDSAR